MRHVCLGAVMVIVERQLGDPRCLIWDTKGEPVVMGEVKAK